MHPELAALLVRQSPDLLWLRDEHGVVFTDVDYDSINGTDRPRAQPITRIEQVCRVDVERLEALTRRVTQRLAQRHAHAYPVELFERFRRRAWVH